MQIKRNKSKKINVVEPPIGHPLILCQLRTATYDSMLHQVIVTTPQPTMTTKCEIERETLTITTIGRVQKIATQGPIFAVGANSFSSQPTKHPGRGNGLMHKCPLQ